MIGSGSEMIDGLTLRGGGLARAKVFCIVGRLSDIDPVSAHCALETLRTPTYF